MMCDKQMHSESMSISLEFVLILMLMGNAILCKEQKTNPFINRYLSSLQVDEHGKPVNIQNYSLHVVL